MPVLGMKSSISLVSYLVSLQLLMRLCVLSCISGPLMFPALWASCSYLLLIFFFYWTVLFCVYLFIGLWRLKNKFSFLLIMHIINIFSWCVDLRSLLEVLNLNSAKFIISFFPSLYICVLLKKPLSSWGPKDMLVQCLKTF